MICYPETAFTDIQISMGLKVQSLHVLIWTSKPWKSHSISFSHDFQYFLKRFCCGTKSLPGLKTSKVRYRCELLIDLKGTRERADFSNIRRQILPLIDSGLKRSLQEMEHFCRIENAVFAVVSPLTRYYWNQLLELNPKTILTSTVYTLLMRIDEVLKHCSCGLIGTYAHSIHEVNCF